MITDDTICRLRRTAQVVVVSLGTFAVMGFLGGSAHAETATGTDTATAATQTQLLSPDETVTSPAASTPSEPAPTTNDESSDPPKPVSSNDTSTLAAPAAQTSASNSADASSAAGNTPTNNEPTSAAPTESSVSNSVASTAQSGNATVANNCTAGDATSGNAAATVTAIVSAGNTTIAGTNVSSFVMTIPGNHSGDIVVDPSTAIPGTATITSAAAAAPATQTETHISAAAASGDASVTSNGTAGNATSGTADAGANVLTLADSSITTPQFFVGVVNVYGDLNGNIVLPAQYASTPLAPMAAAEGQSAPTPSVRIDDTLALNAQSGNATVENNGTAGDALSGSASTRLTECDTVGSQFSGSGAIFVLVNVHGIWTGTVMGDSNAVVVLGTPDAQELLAAPSVDGPMQTIRDIINVSAQSGNARIAENGMAGDATSGSAMASLNLLHLIAANIKTNNWFGVLFINVFGDWLGGVATMSAADPAPTPMANPPAATTIITPTAAPPAKTFAPLRRVHLAARLVPASNVASIATPAQVSVLGSAAPRSSTTASTAATGDTVILWWILGLVTTANVVFAVRYFSRQHKHR